MIIFPCRQAMTMPAIKRGEKSATALPHILQASFRDAYKENQLLELAEILIN